MMPLPSLIAAFTDKAGKILSPWNYYLQQFTQAPPQFLAIAPDGSPFEYEAKEPGYVAVNGGTVSLLEITRGGTFTIQVTGNIAPVAIGDVVRVTYSIAPNVIFMPSYGQRTG